MVSGAETIPAVEQPSNVVEQVNPVAISTDAPVANAAERTVASLPDLSTPEAVREFLKQYPASQAVLADERNAEKQRVLNDQRREQGTQESIQRYHERLVNETRRRLEEGESLDDLVKEAPVFYTAATERNRIDLAKSLIAVAKNVDPEAVEALEAMASATEDMTADKWMGLAQAATNIVEGKAKTTGRSELLNTEDIDALPDSPLKRAIQAKAAKDAEIELNAREIEANRVTAPPSTPNGASSEPMTRSRYEGMSADDRKTYRAMVKSRDGNLDAIWDVISSPV